jgi:hypothetical protein
MQGRPGFIIGKPLLIQGNSIAISVKIIFPE